MDSIFKETAVKPRHFDSFSFVPIDMQLYVDLVDASIAVRRLMTEAQKSVLFLGKNPNDPVLGAANAVSINVSRNQSLSDFLTVSPFWFSHIPGDVFRSVQELVEALTKYNLQLIERLAIRDSQKSGAPKIASPDQITYFKYIAGESQTEQEFHLDGIDLTHLVHSNVPTLMTERELIRDPKNEGAKVIVGDEPGNIPASEIVTAREGEAALWDGEVTNHSGPQSKGSYRELVMMNFTKVVER